MIDLINKTFPFSFYLLNSDFSLWNYEENKKDQREIFVVLRKMDLSKDNVVSPPPQDDRLPYLAATLISRQSYAAASAASAASAGSVVSIRSVSWVQYDKIFGQAKEEYEKTEKIKGYEVYCVNSNIKVWISHYDWEFLKG